MTQNLKIDGLNSQTIWRSPVMLAIAASLITSVISVYTVTRFQNQVNQKQEIPASIQPVVKTVTAMGRLEPKGEVAKLSAATANEGNRVDKLLVKEGASVKAGQIIAIMDSRDRLQASLVEAQKQVQVASSRLDQVKAGAKQGEIGARQATVNRLQVELEGNRKTLQATINRLQAELQGQQQSLQATVARVAAEKRNAQADVQRYETLYKQGAISSQEVDKRRLSAETANQQLIESQATQTRTIATLQQQLVEAKANRDKTIATLQQQLVEAKATLNQTAEVRPTDIANSQAEIESAQATVEKIKAQLEQAYIRAPKSGQILKINTRAGETVGNEGIVDLGQTDQMYAVAEVYQSDINKVRSGQRVRVTGDSLSGELQGTVDWVGMQVQRQNVINTDPSENIDAKVVEVHVQLNEASSKKAANFTNLQVKVVIEL
ncbi:carbamoyl-phosphate synthase L chain, ATP-binding protein [Tolypothrix sp. NIES-4075]|uniref:ABC exporter membrane fusion protein n=1 Tax=Tolypothrix sp. NIES-4075 TaxID=2005459 RepID=UPI000B5C7E92|nr:ABC exporter membrane fusion protein [Tolypothrix sp. NIES-4075]GAX42321.1 carbamoyl-phosphate synthase L chain, ATP-binding protein [Tolypothrix sp. NIES-4075]